MSETEVCNIQTVNNENPEKKKQRKKMGDDQKTYRDNTKASLRKDLHQRDIQISKQCLDYLYDYKGEHGNLELQKLIKKAVSINALNNKKRLTLKLVKLLVDDNTDCKEDVSEE